MNSDKSMANKEAFEVTIKKKDVVVPETPVQVHLLGLSNLDLLNSRGCPSTYFCYKKPVDDKFTFQHMLSLLKKSLAQTLITYYPLAGEMTQNIAGEPEILCNGRGVDFFEAFADVELREIDFYHSDESIGGKLVPYLSPAAILTVQVTELKCGGLVLGGTFDHRLIDAHSSYVFFLAWAEATQGKPLSHKPVFCRSLLNPRHPGSYDSSIEEQYMLVKSAKKSNRNIPQSGEKFSTITRTFYIESKRIKELQSLANKRTKIEAFCAFMWKLIASSVDKSSTNKIKYCRLGVVADGRSRIGSGDVNMAKSMASYYGNVNTIPFGEKSCEELIDKPFSWVANQVHDFLEIAKQEEFYRGLIDWLEAHRPEPAMPRICGTVTREEGPAFLVTSSLRFSIASVDFGWGGSRFSSYYLPALGEMGSVALLPSAIADGDWIVYIKMPKEQMDFIESEATHIIHPITSSYLNLA